MGHPAEIAAVPVPRYHRIYLVLRERLREGRYPARQALPGEVEIAAEFGVSRVTVRAALDRLVGEGLVTRRRGLGTFATGRAESALPHAALSGLLENVVEMGLRTTVRVIETVTIRPPTDVVRALELQPDTLTRKIIRVRSHKGTPLSYNVTFVPEPLAERLGDRVLGARPILQVLEDSGVEVATADQVVSATLADAAVAGLLETEVGAPLLAVERIVRDGDRCPVQLMRGLYRPDRFEYRMHLTRAGRDEARIWVSDPAA
jgi:GntR family transcriptional regulator